MEGLRPTTRCRYVWLSLLFCGVIVIAGYLIWIARTQPIPHHRQQATSTKIPLPAPLVCIDPGHPSEINAGRTRQNGVTEVEMNWRIAKQVISKLTAHGVRVVATKASCDEFVSNRKRAEIANATSAALLLRIHCDTGRGSGYTCYYPDRQGTTQGKTGPSASVMTASHAAATAMHADMAKTLGAALSDNGVKGESATYIGKRQGALTGSIFSEVPVVTVEMVYLSNVNDVAYLRSENGAEQLSEALAQGILRYVQAQ